MNRLKKKRALITREGARVAVTGRTSENLKAARKELGGEVVAIA